MMEMILTRSVRNIQHHKYHPSVPQSFDFKQHGVEKQSKAKVRRVFIRIVCLHVMDYVNVNFVGF